MRAVIVGAGIAGPVLGLFLRRVGIEAVIVEARSAEATGEGAFLGIAPNGMNVLAALELDRKVLSLGHVSRCFGFLNAAGKPIGSIDQRHDVASFGKPMVMIKRADLHGLLLEEAERAGLRVLFDARLSSVDLAQHGVVAHSEDGRHEQGDLLVGCDGLRSRTRSLVFPDAPEPVYSGLLDFGGFTTARGDEGLRPGENTMVFGRRAFFGAFVTERGELWWFHNGREGEPLFGLEQEACRARLLAEHASDPPWIRAVIERTRHVLGPWPLHEVRELSRWHRGRVCLIGDAAHATSPSSGQGASLALEDAMLLARSLRDESEPEQAFASFEQLRRPRVEQIAAHARRTDSSKATPGALKCWLRDRMLPTFLKLGENAQRRAHAYRIEWT